MKPLPSILQHPEHIHPSLWRGSQLAQAACSTISTGFDQLDRELPGLGWPLGALTELALSRSGIGEIHLLGPAFSRLPPERRIALVQPPYVPYAQCWHNWQLDARRLLWVRSGSNGDALWACEQILKHNTCAALLCWLSNVHSASLRRLHLAARQSETMLILLRPQIALQQSSIAPLRLSLVPCRQGLEISIVKRQGPSCGQPVFIALYPAASSPRNLSHVSLDRALPALPQPGHAFSPVAH
ncbi:translesion DNA synthesis-associated protein ImuA [Eoetvoesiella caeni]